MPALSLDSSVGRAEDCSRHQDADILRSLVRIRLEGLFFYIKEVNKVCQESNKTGRKNVPRVRLELTTFRSLLDLYHYETDALPTALPRRTNDLLSPLFKSQGQLKKYTCGIVSTSADWCCGVVVITSA